MINGNLVLCCGTEKDDMGRTLHYLEKIGYKFFGSPRRYESMTTGLTIFRCRDRDIPKLIGVDGSEVDIGICSGASLGEFDGELVKLIDLSYGESHLLVYVNELTAQTKSVEDLRGKEIEIQTSCPNTSSRYCRERGINLKIYQVDAPEP